MAGRRLTIGVTVNLGHYENLKVEVEGEAGDQSNELIRVLDGVLASFGRSDPPTTELIDRYRKRVLGCGEAGPVSHGPETGEDEACEVPESGPQGPCDGDDLPHEDVSGEGPGPDFIEMSLPFEEVEGAGGSSEGIAEEAWVPEQDTPIPLLYEPERAGGEISAMLPEPATCEQCRVTVSPSEEKLSRLFASRVLCRTCLKRMQ